MEFKTSIIRRLIGASVNELSEKYNYERDAIIELLILETLASWTLFEKEKGEVVFKNMLGERISYYYKFEKYLLEADKEH